MDFFLLVVKIPLSVYIQCSYVEFKELKLSTISILFRPPQFVTCSSTSVAGMHFSITEIIVSYNKTMQMNRGSLQRDRCLFADDHVVQRP